MGRRKMAFFCVCNDQMDLDKKYDLKRSFLVRSIFDCQSPSHKLCDKYVLFDSIQTEFRFLLKLKRTTDKNGENSLENNEFLKTWSRMRCISDRNIIFKWWNMLRYWCLKSPTKHSKNSSTVFYSMRFFAFCNRSNQLRFICLGRFFSSNWYFPCHILCLCSRHKNCDFGIQQMDKNLFWQRRRIGCLNVIQCMPVLKRPYLNSSHSYSHKIL